MYNSKKDIAGGVVTGLQAGKSRNCGFIAARVGDFLSSPEISYQLWGPDSILFYKHWQHFPRKQRDGT